LYLEIYPDIIFIINFAIDFILLLLLKMICKRSTSTGRLLLAAAAGGLIAMVVGIFPWMNVFIRFFIMNVSASVIMLLIAYGISSRAEFIRQLICLYLLTYFLGGFINSIYYHSSFRIKLIRLGSLISSNLTWKAVALCIAIACPAFFLGLWLFRRANSKRRQTLDTELILGDMRVSTKGLVDTGNCLYDPVFRRPVIIIERMLLMDLMPAEQYESLLAINKLIADKGQESASLELPANCEQMDTLPFKLRFIPYRSVGRQNGILLGLVLDKVLVRQGKDAICNEKVTAAICDDVLSVCNDYHVILHKELL